MPYSLEQNGVFERKKRTILTMVHCMLQEKHVLKRVLGRNRFLRCILIGQVSYKKKLLTLTPKEAWSSRKPKVDCDILVFMPTF